MKATLQDQEDQKASIIRRGRSFEPLFEPIYRAEELIQSKYPSDVIRVKLKGKDSEGEPRVSYIGGIVGALHGCLDERMTNDGYARDIRHSIAAAIKGGQNPRNVTFGQFDEQMDEATASRPLPVLARAHGVFQRAINRALRENAFSEIEIGTLAKGKIAFDTLIERAPEIVQLRKDLIQYHIEPVRHDMDEERTRPTRNLEQFRGALRRARQVSAARATA